MFGKFSEKVAKAVGERTDYGISINQSEVLAEARRFLQWHSLSELFPYESYDEESGIYLNKKSKGFILEIGSFTGTNDNLEREISGIFKTVLPAGYNIQVMLFASPKIGYYLDNWVDARYQASEFLKEMASKRVEFFKKKALEGTGQARIRDLRIFVSV